MTAYWKDILVPFGIDDTSAKAVLENPLPRYIDMLSRHHDAVLQYTEPRLVLENPPRRSGMNTHRTR